MSKTLSLVAACCGLLGATTSLPAADATSLIGNLNSSDYEARQSARLELRQTLADASPSELRSLEKQLIAAIGPDRDWATRDWSIRMLELVGTKTAVKPLADLLDDADPRVRDLARRALAANPSGRAAATLERAAVSASAAERDAYAEALAYRQQTRAVRELSKLLQAGSTDAADALGKIGNASARRALEKALPSAEGDFRTAIELALLDAGVTRTVLATDLLNTGSSPAVRAAAFEALLSLDRRAAESALKEAPPALRPVLLRKAMGSALRTDIVASLPQLPETEKIIVLGAIADLGLSGFEADVLALLDSATATLKPVVIRTLGLIGSDDSFEPLLELYLADDGDRVVSAALARLKAPSTDSSLLATATGGDAIDDRVAALRLLVLRSTEGITQLLNQLGKPGNDPAIREAAFEGMEVVGDVDSVKLLLDVILANDSIKRPAQVSLKKLSANLGVPEFLWEQCYAPALSAAANDEGRRDVFVILDGNSGAGPAAYLQQLVLEDHALRPDAMRALQRWTDISGVDAWLAIAAAENTTEADVALAKRSIVRILGSTRTTGLFGDKVERAVAALEAFPSDTDFKLSVLKTYDDDLHWRTRMRINQLFPDLKHSEDIAAEVKALLERTRFN